MPRFVILRHEGSASYKPGVHWDFLLESGGCLRAWSLAAEPAAERSIAAEQLADHRLAYLDFEGPVSGDRGVVSRWDAGEYEPLLMGENELSFRLAGGRLFGVVRLSCDKLERWTWRISTV